MTNKPFTEPGHRRRTPAAPAATRYASTDDLTLITERERRELSHLSGMLTAVKTELARVESEDDTPADVLAYWREECRVCQDEYDMEWAALCALQELRAGITPEMARKAVKPRCEFYHSIKSFYAAAQGVGLNVKANARMRDALGCFFNRPVTSRRELSASDWNRATTAVSVGELYW